jgi:tRNA pseudouridine38-40 synthase
MQVHYDWYNKKYGNNGFHETLDFADVDKEVEEFRRTHIFPVIIKGEKEEKSYPFI